MKSPMQRRGLTPAGGGPINRSVLKGLLLIARGRREGLDCFGATPDAFLAALSPWLAFLLVGALLTMLRKPTAIGATLFLLSFCALLLPPVLSHALAGNWKRSAFWLRYATAAVWCEWLVIFAYAASLLMVTVLLQLGVPAEIAGIAFLGLVACYWLWLHWFLAWRGLALGWGQAALLVGAVIVATALLCGLAQVLPPHVGMFVTAHGQATTSN
jgi:hypothetical protein